VIQSIGPIKITGNLTIAGKIAVTLQGVVYVEGEVIIDNNADIVLDEAFGDFSTMIIAEDDIQAIGNGWIGSSGGGVILALSTNVDDDGDPEPPVDVKSANQDKADVIVVAKKGTAKVDAGARAIAGKKTELKSGAKIDHMNKLANLKFVGDINDTLWSFKPGSRKE